MNEIINKWKGNNELNSLGYHGPTCVDVFEHEREVKLESQHGQSFLVQSSRNVSKGIRLPQEDDRRQYQGMKPGWI